MDTWVKNIKTGKTWKLDEDSTKPVYEINGQLQMELRDISKYRFYPFNPDLEEKEKEGYQLTIFDLEEET